VQNFEARVGRDDPHHGVGEGVAGQIQLLDLVKVEVRVERRQASQSVLRQIQYTQSAAAATTTSDTVDDDYFAY